MKKPEQEQLHECWALENMSFLQGGSGSNLITSTGHGTSASEHKQSKCSNLNVKPASRRKAPIRRRFICRAITLR